MGYPTTKTVVIEKLFVNDSKRDGTKYVDKNGRPYKKVKLVADGVPYWSPPIYSRSNPTLKIRRGEEVTIEVEYVEFQDSPGEGLWNFRLPGADEDYPDSEESAPEDLSAIVPKLDALAERLEEVYRDQGVMMESVNLILKKTLGGSTPEDELPF